MSTMTYDDARLQFPQIIDRVASGEEIVITQNGSPVVRLTSVRLPTSREARLTAVVAMRQLAARHRLEGLRIRDLIAEGRR